MLAPCTARGSLLPNLFGGSLHPQFSAGLFSRRRHGDVIRNTHPCPERSRRDAIRKGHSQQSPKCKRGVIARRPQADAAISFRISNLRNSCLFRISCLVFRVFLNYGRVVMAHQLFPRKQIVKASLPLYFCATNFFKLRILNYNSSCDNFFAISSGKC